MKDFFFMGGNTPDGFYTPLDEFVYGSNYHAYILKGGPGTGKSTLMKKIAGQFEGTEDVTVFYCSSDPDSLDAVVLHSSKVVIVDGTAPHVFDPKYPGIGETIINLGAFWDEEALKSHRDEIIHSINMKKVVMDSSASHAHALGIICRDILNLAGSFLIHEKVKEVAEGFCDGIFNGAGRHKGAKKIRILSSMTRNGYMTQYDTFSNYKKIYLLKDDMFAASKLFLDLVSESALDCGLNVKVSPCLLMGKSHIEHLLIDDLGIAITSSNALNNISFESLNIDTEIIDLFGYYDKEKMSPLKDHINNELRLMEHLSNSSIEILKEAKQIHDNTESYYAGAMDFKALDRICDELHRKIRERSL